jgi:hypothetical protein
MSNTKAEFYPEASDDPSKHWRYRVTGTGTGDAGYHGRDRFYWYPNAVLFALEHSTKNMAIISDRNLWPIAIYFGMERLYHYSEAPHENPDSQ